ncbi:MAG: RNA methyltransferase substrate-binding domain-containing protein, partial [Actinomycetota bacterium]
MLDEPQRRGTSGLVSGRRAVEQLLTSSKGAQKVLIVRDRADDAAVARIRKLAGLGNVPVRLVEREEVDRVAKGLNHQG